MCHFFDERIKIIDERQGRRQLRGGRNREHQRRNAARRSAIQKPDGKPRRNLR